MITNAMTTNDPYYGYQDGARVRDRRDGSTGTVHYLKLTQEEWATDEYAVAEVRWAGSCVADELDVAVPHLDRIAVAP